MLTKGRYGIESKTNKFWAMIYYCMPEYPQRTNIVGAKGNLESEDDVYAYFIDNGIDVFNIEYYGKTIFG